MVAEAVVLWVVAGPRRDWSDVCGRPRCGRPAVADRPSPFLIADIDFVMAEGASPARSANGGGGGSAAAAAVASAVAGAASPAISRARTPQPHQTEEVILFTLY